MARTKKITKEAKTKKDIKAVLLATLAAAAVSTAAAAVTSFKLLADVAVNKTLPKRVYKMQDKLSGGGADEEIINTINQNGELLKSTVTERVAIQSRDGLTLVGHWYPAENAKRIVVAMHGWRSSWYADFGTSARFMHDTGCSVLYPDQRSQGESGGEHIGFGVLERYDCFDWVNYVIERFGSELPIYLCGISMGATTVLMASEFEYPPCVKGIISDCGFTSPRAIWSHVLKNNLHISDKIGYPIANYFVNKKASFDGDEMSTVDALRKNRLPVLFVHGDDDKFVPVQMTYENYAACTAEKTMLIAPGAGHGMSYFTDPEGYKSAVAGFFARHDK
ncbi:MAG: alpha/beta fold hydrolase [Clostridia bacterium]|nr:alpha/beta fold hydrolase [Clostridia bacterium]